MPVFSETAIQISGVNTPSMSKVTIDCFTRGTFQFTGGVASRCVAPLSEREAPSRSGCESAEHIGLGRGLCSGALRVGKVRAPGDALRSSRSLTRDTSVALWAFESAVWKNSIGKRIALAQIHFMARRPDIVRIRVPASTSNLGSGFDTLGLALKLHNHIGVTRIAEQAISIVSPIAT